MLKRHFWVKTRRRRREKKKLFVDVKNPWKDLGKTKRKLANRTKENVSQRQILWQNFKNFFFSEKQKKVCTKVVSN